MMGVGGIVVLVVVAVSVFALTVLVVRGDDSNHRDTGG